MSDDESASVEDRSSRSFRASIRSYAAGDLVTAHAEDGYELRAGDELLGWVGDPRASAEVGCATRDGEWRFERLRGGHIEARMGTAVVARYESKLLPGGTIVLPDETRLRLRRPSVAGETWRLRRGRRDLVLAIRPLRVGWAIGFGPAARELQQLPLITMLSFHALLSALAAVTGGGSDSGPGVGF